MRQSGRIVRAAGAGKPEVVPTYTMEDAEGVLEHFAGCDYNKIIVYARESVSGLLM